MVGRREGGANLIRFKGNRAERRRAKKRPRCALAPTPQRKTTFCRRSNGGREEAFCRQALWRYENLNQEKLEWRRIQDSIERNGGAFQSQNRGEEVPKRSEQTGDRCSSVDNRAASCRGDGGAINCGRCFAVSPQYSTL